MKNLLSIALAAILCALCFASCSDKKAEPKSEPATSAETTAAKEIDKTGLKILFKDDYKSDEVTATLISSAGEQKDASVELVSKDDDSNLYACYGDAEKYDKVMFTCDDSDTIELAFNDLVSGWHRTMNGVVPFTEGKDEVDVIDYALETFDYGSGEKEVYICTPDDYDKDSAEQYPVIYMTDGQNLFEKKATSYGSWGVYESVRSISDKTGAVIVGVANPSTTRDRELTPDIGDVTQNPETYEDGKGKEFSDFVYDTVVPFVEKNYNVRTDPDGVAVCGSSSGGIECFYIGMEHPDKFGFIGALSPAFALYDDATWAEYLGEKNLKDSKQKVYIYCGEGDDLETFLMTGAKAMPKTLIEAGFPSDGIKTSFYEKGAHNEAYWRAIFPDFLKFFLG